MRLFIKIKSLKNSFYDIQYFLKIQSVVYSILKDTSLNNLHNKNSYKFFCFSNIFPVENFKKDKNYQFIVSSPDQNFINILKKQLEVKKEINIGKNKFLIEKVLGIKPRIVFPLKLITDTPIIVRIPKEKYQEYGIHSSKNYPYLFWRPEYPFQAFIKQIEDNIFKKYRKFYQKETEEFPIFQKFLFKKSVSIPLKIHGQKVNFVGSLWEFHFDFLDQKTKEILELAIDCGFGENNSKGFGFVNIKKYEY